LFVVQVRTVRYFKGLEKVHMELLKNENYFSGQQVQRNETPKSRSNTVEN
jgi:hypothetical protein